MFRFPFNKKDQLFEAAKLGDEKTVLKLLNGGTNVNSKAKNGGTPLHNACHGGHLHIVELLLKRGAELETTSDEGITPLLNACGKGHLDVVKYLSDQGANIEARSQIGTTPLIMACYHGYLDIVKYLLDKGANIEAEDIYGRTSVHRACENSHFEVIKELLKRGADVNAKNNNYQTLSNYAKTDEILKLFSDQKLSFYEELYSNDSDLLNKMGKLSLLVGDVHEMKILYTMAMCCMRLNIIDSQVCKMCIGTGLAKTAETCATEDAIVIYKIILKKARKDNIISDSDFFRLDNRAEVKRMSEADFIKDMKKAIEASTQRIKNLEHRAGEMENALHLVVNHIKFQRKVEAVVGIVCGIVDAFSFNIGGSLLKAFSKLTLNIVDFGDVEHIKEEIQVLIEHPDGTQEVTTGCYIFDGPAKELEEQFLVGVCIGEKILGSLPIDKDFKDVSSAVTALGRASAVASFTPPAPVNSRVVVHDNPVSPGASSANSHNDDDNNNNNESQTTSSLVFPDAVLSEEDEDKFVLHCAVKYGNIEDIKKEVVLMKDINVCDSQGRTALDLAALTGQLEVMELISELGGEFCYRRRPRMNAIARIRAADSEKYLKQVHDSLK